MNTQFKPDPVSTLFTHCISCLSLMQLRWPQKIQFLQSLNCCSWEYSDFYSVQDFRFNLTSHVWPPKNEMNYQTDVKILLCLISWLWTFNLIRMKSFSALSIWVNGYNLILNSKIRVGQGHTLKVLCSETLSWSWEASPQSTPSCLHCCASPVVF